MRWPSRLMHFMPFAAMQRHLDADKLYRFERYYMLFYHRHRHMPLFVVLWLDAASTTRLGAHDGLCRPCFRWWILLMIPDDGSSSTDA